MPLGRSSKGRFMSKRLAAHHRRLNQLTKNRWQKDREQSAAVSCARSPNTDHMYGATDSDSMRCTEPESDSDSVAAEVDVVSGDAATSEWAEGRRIVELGVLAKALQHCAGCKMQMQLHNCVGETTCGLGSILHIRCDNPSCLVINKVPTGKRHRRGQRGPPTFDVNTKLAIGMSVS